MPEDPFIIVVGVDGSDASGAAVAWAAAHARRLGARLVIAHAVGLLDHLEDPDRSDAEAMLAGEWSAPARALGVEITTVIVDGPPPIALDRVATDAGAGLIVVSSRSHGGAPGDLLGSTSHALAQSARVPVVIVPAAHL